MRLLLDEGFPSAPGFDPSAVDATVEVVALRSFDRGLVGGEDARLVSVSASRRGRFDALVTSDWHQSEQPEELCALTRTRLSIITWKRPADDPIREWGSCSRTYPRSGG